MKPLKHLVNAFLQKNGMWYQYKQNVVLEKWDDIVGKEIAALARPYRAVKGNIFIEVKDSTWLYHLSFMKPQIIGKINKYIGDQYIKELYFKIGVFEEQEILPDEGNNNAAGNTGEKSKFLVGIRKIKEMDTLRKP